MTADRYLPRAPSLRPAPKRRPEPTIKGDWIVHTYDDGSTSLEALNSPLTVVDLPAPPTRGPWEPKED